MGHGDNYFSTLEHANVKKKKGAEYSYLTDNNILFLVSYGETVNSADGSANINVNGSGHANANGIANGNGNGSNADHGIRENVIEDDNNNAFLAAITYRTASNYKIGLIYNNTEIRGDTYYSLILPIEKEYSVFTWNSSLVYANDANDDYIGIENAFTFPLGDMEHIKAIVNADRDENDDTNFGYSLGYTKIYKMCYFSAVAARVNAETYNSNKLTGTINLIF